MAKITSFEIMAADIPFRKPFKHAEASRSTSSSIFIKCSTDNGISGYGECLPRSYVTGETRDSAFDMLLQKVLPSLVGKRFNHLDEVIQFLKECDGKAPQEVVDSGQPQTAAWCAVDLALLDTFGKAFNTPFYLDNNRSLHPSLRYSMVISSDAGLATLLLLRLMSFRQVKLKVEEENVAESSRLTRKILGSRCDIRADANMAWSAEKALVNMRQLADLGIRSFEQPIPAEDIENLAWLVKESGLGVMVDESLHDADSLEHLIEKKGCTAVNVRISKCGGLVAAHKRCIRALESGLLVQVGCQVGESSLLSAAHLKLLAAVYQVKYAEGCFGRLLLRKDPVEPLLQCGYGGRPPRIPNEPGLGVRVNEEMLKQYCSRVEVIR